MSKIVTVKLLINADTDAETFDAVHTIMDDAQMSPDSPLMDWGYPRTVTPLPTFEADDYYESGDFLVAPAPERSALADDVTLTLTYGKVIAVLEALESHYDTLLQQADEAADDRAQWLHDTTMVEARSLLPLYAAIAASVPAGPLGHHISAHLLGEAIRLEQADPEPLTAAPKLLAPDPAPATWDGHGCPFCHNDGQNVVWAVGYETLENENEIDRGENHCNDCGKEWHEYYRLFEAVETLPNGEPGETVTYDPAYAAPPTAAQ